jgi:hypothetical protein
MNQKEQCRLIVRPRFAISLQCICLVQQAAFKSCTHFSIVRDKSALAVVRPMISC